MPFPSHVPNMTLELMPTWDHPEEDGFVILASTAMGPYRPRLRAVLSANRTTPLRAIFNGSYFYFRYYEQVRLLLLMTCLACKRSPRSSTGPASISGLMSRCVDCY